MGQEWPASPFWHFATALYRRPGIEDACLRLQDGAGVDVLLLLLACWLGSDGRLIEVAPAAAAVAAARGWRERVVEPLRRARRELKGLGGPTQAAESERVLALRRSIGNAELAAERLAMLELERLAGGSALIDEPNRGALIGANLARLGIRVSLEGPELNLLVANALGIEHQGGEPATEC